MAVDNLIQFRHAVGEDFEKMVELQNGNLITTLGDQKSDGFLSAAFTAEQFTEFRESVAVIVAVDDTSVVGFACASTVEFCKQNPLPASMIARFAGIVIGGKNLAELRSVICGPICVAKNFRGKGIFEELYSTLFRSVGNDFDVALALVSTENPRSIKAHEKIAMTSVDNFEFNGREFYTVARMLS